MIKDETNTRYSQIQSHIETSEHILFKSNSMSIVYNNKNPKRAKLIFNMIKTWKRLNKKICLSLLLF